MIRNRKCRGVTVQAENHHLAPTRGLYDSARQRLYPPGGGSKPHLGPHTPWANRNRKSPYLDFVVRRSPPGCAAGLASERQRGFEARAFTLDVTEPLLGRMRAVASETEPSGRLPES